MIDLISERVGGEVVACNDEFFAEVANLIKSEPPVWREGEYTDRGKWMDGWETRRRRDVGHDWCLLRLGIPGRIRRVVVDTAFFTGNYPEAFSLEAAGTDQPDESDWVELIGRTSLEGDSTAEFSLDDPRRVVSLRFNIFPDGGVARLRVEGDPIPEMGIVCPDGSTDLVSAMVGGEIVDASDVHYSHPSNCLRPLPSAGMWDGWETRRRRDQGHDWIVARLGLPGTIDRIVADTTHFKGNAPGWVSVDISHDGETWDCVADHIAVAAHAENEIPVVTDEVAEMIRLSIFPDGGLARLRAFGRPDRAAAGVVRVGYLNSLFDSEARRFFHTACASSKWAEAMASARPFATVQAIMDTAEEMFERLESADWLEAFAGHPRIGERGDAHSDREQSGAKGAGDDVRRRLAEVNAGYEDRHGFTYIVYATGKSAEEMLSIAESRLGNDTADEVRNAASEQRKITATRLKRMLCQEER